MIGIEEARILQECQRGQSDNLCNQRYFQDDLEEAAELLSIDDAKLTDLIRLFSVNNIGVCEKHRVSIESCGCTEGRETNLESYTYNKERFVEEIVEAMHNKRYFSEIDRTNDNEISLRFSDHDIEFILFDDVQEANTATTEPKSLIFACSLVDNGSQINDYVFTWYDLIDPGFEDRLSSIISELVSPICSDFYEYDTIERVRPEVRKSIKEYFRDNGYNVSGEITEIAGELSKYSLDISLSDFVAYNNESKIVICHCGSSDGWHAHHLKDSNIKSVEDLAVFTEMSSRISEKISTYRQIQNDKETSSKFVKTMAGALAVAPVALTLLNPGLGFVYNTLKSDLSVNIAKLWVLFLVIYTIIAAVFIWLISKPYIQDMRFDWSITKVSWGTRLKLSVRQTVDRFR